MQGCLYIYIHSQIELNTKFYKWSWFNENSYASIKSANSVLFEISFVLNASVVSIITDAGMNSRVWVMKLEEDHIRMRELEKKHHKRIEQQDNTLSLPAAAMLIKNLVAEKKICG